MAMTVEEKRKFDQMERDIQSLLIFMKNKKQQQITFPLDESSRRIIIKVITP